MNVYSVEVFNGCSDHIFHPLYLMVITLCLLAGTHESVAWIRFRFYCAALYDVYSRAKENYRFYHTLASVKICRA